MSDAGFLRRERKKREHEDIRKYMPVLGKVLNSSVPRNKTDTKWKTRDKWKNKRRQLPNTLEKSGAATLRSIPAIALSNGVRKKSTIRKSHTSPNKAAERSVDNADNIPPLTNPPPLPDFKHSPEAQLAHHDFTKQASPTPDEHVSFKKVPDPYPDEGTDASELPLSWDSIIDGSLPSQPQTRYDISDSALAAVMNCDTQQILAEL